MMLHTYYQTISTNLLKIYILIFTVKNIYLILILLIPCFLTFCSTIEFNPYLPFEFLIFLSF